MIGLRIAAASAAFVCASAIVADGASYAPSARRALIAAALSELTGDLEAASQLRSEIRDRGRSRCRGNARALVVRCYLEVAADSCGGRGPSCPALADIIVVNHLGENSFISDADRYKLMNDSENFRDAVDAELRRRYARLAAELALATEVAVDAAAIDVFCIERARLGTLPWQRCVAALVWFIGTEQQP